MKISVSNVGVSQCKFCGINVGKGINAGVEAMRNRVKNVDSFSSENLPNKVVKKVLGGPQGHPYTGRSTPPPDDSQVINNDSFLEKLKDCYYELTGKPSPTIGDDLAEAGEKNGGNDGGLLDSITESIGNFFDNLFN